MSIQGRFVWYELMAKDVARARDFYGKVIGWTSGEPEMPGMPYWVWKHEGARIAGLMELPEAAARMGSPPCWVGYVGVDDLDASLAKTQELGGKVLMPAQEVPTVGRFALITDPHGAAIMLFLPAPGSQGTARDPKAVGHVGWNELHAGDGAQDLDFYSQLFGWQEQDRFDMGPMGTYQMYGIGDVTFGGIMNKPPEVPVPHWNYYFNVGPIDAAAERVKANGGTIAFGPSSVPGGGFILVGQDPDGAFFCLLGERQAA